MITDVDRELLVEAREGSKKAFGKLVEKYRDKILYLAIDLIGNYDDAQDIAQNAFLKAYEKLPDFRMQSTFSTWLYRIVVNLAIDYRRSEARRHKHFVRSSTDERGNARVLNVQDLDDLPDRKMMTNDYQEIIRRIINELPEQQRIAFTLRHFHGMRMKEISEVLGCQDGTVRSHIFRALGKIREKLNELENEK